ncbi:M20/M25/M40 family metallo-hydrolase [Amaricoccus sp.]|uniref:M20/M25/M40 family metallo-hydrolase n=1 Tax=Amaricoccus sp. TaxID=1872485 RepID=UPI001B63CEC7|nr:M20/M25/M40 family metallo-hydrolase [Amaricoccus sp.]MBP7241784.1 M20/M25/M40 family metallo-hydrolase [Amaricoccus sp.]
MSDLDRVLAHVDADQENALARLFETLRIRSISTDPAYAGACRDCADWHVRDLASIGFAATAHPTPGHPVVVAHLREGDGPSALFYGHYDVQPVDPLELWTRDPFDPAIETRADGTKEIRARGASDDKGQVMTFVEACRAWKAVTGRLPIPVTVLIEGEEESGGKSLPPFLAAHAGELRADIGLVCDTGMWDAQTPLITTMLRGLCGEEITIICADRDLHSGAYGSAARNPNHVLAKILADLHDEDGRVTIPGFYDGVHELPEAMRESWARLDFPEAEFLGAVGLSIPAGERGRSVLEQITSRPTAEVNGMGGGYQGAGFKTVIPSRASAKVSFRLVFEQDPGKVRAAFRDFVRARVPADCKVEFEEHGSGRATTFSPDGPAFRATAAALEAEWGRPPAILGMGGSIPVSADIKELLGMDVVLTGFALDDDRIHSPNEKYDLASFHRGIRSWARILDALSRT